VVFDPVSWGTAASAVLGGVGALKGKSGGSGAPPDMSSPFASMAVSDVPVSFGEFVVYGGGATGAPAVALDTVRTAKTAVPYFALAGVAAALVLAIVVTRR